MTGKGKNTWIWPVVLAVLAILALMVSCKTASPEFGGGQTVTPIVTADMAPVNAPAQQGTVNIAWQDAAIGAGGIGALALFTFIVWRMIRLLRTIVLAVVNRNGKRKPIVTTSERDARYARLGAKPKG